MLPTDSIHSYNAEMPGFDLGREGFLSPSENNELPVDVIEALQKDDLDLALQLLRDHRKEPRKGPSNAIMRLMTNLVKALRFNFHVVKPAKKKGKKGPKKVSQTNKNAQSQTSKSGRMGRAMVQAFTKVVKVPVQFIVATMNAGKNIIVKTVQTVQVKVVKPLIAPFIKATEYLAEKYRSIETFLSEKIDYVSEKFKEVREVVKEKVEKFVEEIKELSKPVENWLKLKFDKFTEQRRWIKETFGKQYENFVEISEMTINVIAMIAVPVTFCVKQLNLSLNFLRKKFANHKNRFKSFYKKVSGYIGAKLKAFADAVRPFKDAFLRVLQMIVNVVHTLIIWMIHLIIELMRAAWKFLVWLKNLFMKLYSKWVK